MINMQKCTIHGICKHTQTSSCELCASENKKPSEIKELQTKIIAIADILYDWLERKDNFINSTVGYETVKSLNQLFNKKS